jgi:small subunit ribosomal protein S21|tara:strand:+ start:2357 stop:2569 length:213 start_codon:yes stop_codon:yes gene_type:complete
MATNITVKPRKNEDPNRFIKRFQRKCKKSGIFDEVRERRHFRKPSEKKRLAKKKAISRHKKRMRKMAQNN